MSALIGIIGLASGVLQNINTPSSFFPPQHSSSTKVRVYAGLSSNATESPSGNIPGVALWNSDAGFIGKAMGIYNYVIDSGKFYDLTVKGKKASAAYLSVSAFGKDDLCVAAVGVTSPTGFQAGWFGDVGMKCGVPWYPSDLVIPGSDPEARPACVWITQDTTTTHPFKGITMHLPSFTGEGLAQEYSNDTDTMCKSLPRFSMWETRSVHMTLPVYNMPLEFNSDGSDKDLNMILDPPMMDSETTAPNDPTGKKLGVAAGPSATRLGAVQQVGPSKRRSKRTLFQPLHDQLVVSNITSHSAKEVCGSATSAGPDFVSTHECLFCDMNTKILWPLCSTSLGESCFDLETRSFEWRGVDEGRAFIPSGLKKRDAVKEDKWYRNVHEWT